MAVDDTLKKRGTAERLHPRGDVLRAEGADLLRPSVRSRLRAAQQIEPGRARAEQLQAGLHQQGEHLAADGAAALPCSIDLSLDEWRSVFARFRAMGVEPHPYGEEGDDWAAELLVQPSLAGEALSPEECVRPDERLGVNGVMFVQDEPDDPNAPSTIQFGQWPEICRDLAKVGIGLIHHVYYPDLWIKQLFRSDYVIPPPDDFHQELIADSFQVFSRFTWLALCCAASGLKAMPVLFDAGGDDKVNLDLAGWDAIVAGGKPVHQTAPVVLTTGGWDAFYHGIMPDKADMAHATYQRYAVTVYVSSSQIDCVAYLEECARRKALAVAAYGQAVGKYLVALHGAFQAALRIGLTDVVPAVELMEEWDSRWAGSIESSREMGRLMALLAGPLWYEASATGIQVRAGDIFGYHNDRGVWEKATQWLANSITVGMKEEVDRWNQFWSPTSAAGILDLALWAQSIEASGFCWPPQGTTFRLADLMHGVGFHWFHHTNESDDPNADLTYMDQTVLGGDVSEWSTRVLWAVHCGTGLDLPWMLAAISAVPGEQPEYLATCYRGTNPEYQAGQLVRNLTYGLAVRAGTAHAAAVHHYNRQSHVVDLTSPNDALAWWVFFSGTGLRNDTFSSDGGQYPWYQYAYQPSGFQQNTHAWRRPAWFSFRRMAWLLQHSENQEVLLSDREQMAVVVGFFANSGGFGSPSMFISPSNAAVLGLVSYRRAYIAWIDCTSTCTAFHFRLCFEAEDPAPGYRILEMVPTVNLDGMVQYAVDENGYQTGEEVEWSVRSTHRVTSTADGIEVLVGIADPTRNPAPICVLTNAEWVDDWDFKAHAQGEDDDQESVAEEELPPAEGSDENRNYLPKTR